MKSINDVTDEAIFQALNNVYEQEDEQLLEEMKSADFVLDKETEQRMRKKIETYSKKNRRIVRIKRTLRFCALIMFMLITVSTVGVATASMYKDILNPRINTDEDTLDFSFDLNGESVPVSEIEVKFAWLPEGYKETGVDYRKDKTIWYMADENALAMFSVENGASDKRYNTEMFSWELIDINGTPGYFFEAEEYKTWRVCWEYKGYVCMAKFTDDADMNKETIIRIAEGVTIQPKSKK